jgi:hypothetical protein
MHDNRRDCEHFLVYSILTWHKCADSFIKILVQCKSELCDAWVVGYLRKFSVSRLLSVRWQDDSWMLKWEGLGRKVSWPDRDTVPQFAWRDLQIPRKTPVRTADVPSDIQTGNLCYALGRSILYNQVLAEMGLRIKGSFVEFETEMKGNGLRPERPTGWHDWLECWRTGMRYLLSA